MNRTDDASRREAEERDRKRVLLQLEIADAGKPPHKRHFQGELRYFLFADIGEGRGPGLMVYTQHDFDAPKRGEDNPGPIGFIPLSEIYDGYGHRIPELRSINEKQDEQITRLMAIIAEVRRVTDDNTPPAPVDEAATESSGR